MSTYLTNKHKMPAVETTNSISDEFNDGFTTLLSSEIGLRSPYNEARLKKATDTGSQPDLLEEFRKMLRDM